jgi:pyrimidine nucleoside transport protein
MTVLALLTTLIAFETRDDYHRLRSLIGIITFIVVGYIFSYNKYAVNWRTVLCGFSVQFLLGVACIRWDVGRAVFKCFSDQIATFLHYSQDGASFVFGQFLVTEANIFVFSSLPTIFFFSLCISILSYLGVMQVVLMKLGWIFSSILGTTVCESVNAAGNIFLGQSQSPMMIKSYIRILTNSELHAVMTSGFSTVAGAVLVAYISFGAEPYHLICASIMAAPASLFFSKLFYPETEKTLTSSENIQLERS